MRIYKSKVFIMVKAHTLFLYIIRFYIKIKLEIDAHKCISFHYNVLLEIFCKRRILKNVIKNR